MPNLAFVAVQVGDKKYVRRVYAHDIEIASMGEKKAFKYYLRKAFKDLEADIFFAPPKQKENRS